MTAQLQAELDRLTNLRAVNDHVRPEEIELTQAQLAELTTTLAQARLRLDAVRLSGKAIRRRFGVNLTSPFRLLPFQSPNHVASPETHSSRDQRYHRGGRSSLQDSHCRWQLPGLVHVRAECRTRFAQPYAGRGDLRQDGCAAQCRTDRGGQYDGHPRTIRTRSSDRHRSGPSTRNSSTKPA